MAASSMNNGETQYVLEAMKMEDEKFKTNKLLGEGEIRGNVLRHVGTCYMPLLGVGGSS